MSSLIFRYMVTELNGGSLLRIEPVRKKQEDTEFECVAENGVGDPVSVKAHLHVYDGKDTNMKSYQRKLVIRFFRQTILYCLQLFWNYDPNS